MTKTAEAETKLLALLAARKIDGHSTKDVAALIGASEATTLSLLMRFSDEDFKADDGSTLNYNEVETRHNQRKSGGFTSIREGQPVKYLWFFT